MHILIVDDSREDRELIVTYLKKTDGKKQIHTDESSNLTDAISKIEINNYDAILLDLALPETDGIQTIKEIKDQIEKTGKNTPIIILTGLEDYSIGVKAFSLGVKNFLLKDEIESNDIYRALALATYNKKISLSA